jgi:STE24 endopeptidase
VNEDKASRYHRLKRQAGVASLLCGVSLLMTLVASGLTLRIRTTAESIAPGSPGSVSAWIAGVLVYVTLLSALNEAVSLPIAFYSGFLLERRYGLGTESISTWLLDQAKSFALGLLLAGGAAVLLYAAIAWSPCRPRRRARAWRLRVGPRGEDEEGQRGARRSRCHAPHSGVGHDARGLLGGRD